jgi:hypothetical protein
MKRKSWYNISLFLPMILPFIAMPLFQDGGKISGAFEIFSAIFLLGVIIGGLPYLLFVIGVWWWSRHKTADDMKRLSYIVPVLFYPFCALGITLISLTGVPMDSGFQKVATSASGALFAGLLMAGFAIPIGYFYVGLVHVLTKILMAIRLVKD